MEERETDTSRGKVVVHDHSYPKLHVFGTRNLKFVNLCHPLPTIHLFAKEGVEESQDDISNSCKRQKLDPAVEGSSIQEDLEVEGDEELDVVSVDKVPHLPLDDSKVRSVMVECEKYVNLVRLVTKHQHQEEVYVVFLCLFYKGVICNARYRLLCICNQNQLPRPLDLCQVIGQRQKFATRNR